MVSRRALLIGTVGLAASALPSCYAKPPKPFPYAPTPEEELRERIAARVRSFHPAAPDAGIAVGLWQEGRPSVFGFGRTSYHDPKPPNADSLFELGGLGEILVGILLGELVARKRAGLDDPAQAHLPPSVKLPEKAEQPITLRQLALHTSGLPMAPDLDRAARDEPALAALLGKTRPETAPGQRFQPSNLGIAVLGHALATREGRPIGWLLRQRVALPLGMTSTSTFERDVALDENRLVEGRDARAQRAAPRFDVPLLSTHALRTSVNDLLRLLAVVLTPGANPLASAVHAAIGTRRPLGDGTEVAAGWRYDPARDHLWQAGESAAFRAAVLVDRPRSRALALCVASAAIDARGLLFEIAREESLPSSRAIRPTGPTVRELPPNAIRANVLIDRLVRFTGHRVESPVAHPGDTLRITLYWQCLARIGDDLRVIVSGVDETGRERLRADHYPADGRYPTYQWRVGDVVADELAIRLPEGFDAGRLTFWLGLGAGGGVLRPEPGPEVDIGGRIRGPSVEITRK
ncbi:MAG: beta-lactamase family protein [Myxococcales bacterium]|nr:beta-lactamase family protein [Myxococcales bacterium]